VFSHTKEIPQNEIKDKIEVKALIIEERLQGVRLDRELHEIWKMNIQKGS
jgi:hypothetical protein